MKTILVPVEQHDSIQSILALVVLAAKHLDASIEGFALRPPPLAALGWDAAGVTGIPSVEWNDQQIETTARELFRSFMTGQGLEEAHDQPGPAMPPAGSPPTWRWQPDAMAGDEFLGSYARAFDLTVVGQPDPRGRGSSITTLEAALFDSGGPILIAPHEPPTVIGNTIVIVWNGSSETARTIAFAKPLLRQARRVAILDDDGGLGQRPSGALVQRRLAQNGIPSELVTLADGRIRSGEAVLQEAGRLECDLLIKGAYTQSRLRQMIFGGATRHILAEARIPVFMAH